MVGFLFIFFNWPRVFFSRGPGDSTRHLASNFPPETALLRVQNDILQSSDKRESAILVLLDLSAALAPLDMTFCYRDWNNGLESVGMFFCDLNRTCHLVVSLLILTGPTPQRDIRGASRQCARTTSVLIIYKRPSELSHP